MIKQQNCFSIFSNLNMIKLKVNNNSNSYKPRGSIQITQLTENLHTHVIQKYNYNNPVIIQNTFISSQKQLIESIIVEQHYTNILCNIAARVKDQQYLEFFTDRFLKDIG